MARLAAIALVVTTTILMVPSVVSAQVSDGLWSAEQRDRYREHVDESRWAVPDDLSERASTLLFQEIALLERVDGFAGTSPIVDQVDQAFRRTPGAGRQTLLLALGSVDADLAAVKSALLTHTELASQVTDALDDLATNWKNRLAAGETGVVPVQPYLAAMSALLSYGSAGTLPLADRGIEFSDLGPRLAATTSGWELFDLTGLDRPDGAASGGTPQESAASSLIPIVIVAATALIVGILLVALLRRRRIVAPGHDLSSAIRELIGAETEQDVEQIAIPVATAVTGGDDGMLLRSDDYGVRRAGSPWPIGSTRFSDAVETGATINEIVESDPALGGHTASVLAVPIVTGGIVVGVLAVHRSPDDPFGPAERHELERLGPPVAAALGNVDRLGSMAELALVDELTSLGNRRRMDRDLHASVAQSALHGSPVAFAMIDVDHFKQFNDTHGHTAGDDALQAVATAIASTVRHADIVYRYGGEEFSILLPGATPIEAGQVAERVRLAVETAPIAGEHTQPGGRLTVSVGVSTLPSADTGAIANRADQALYDAKLAGRNRVVLA